jgi:small conductance mechanosensitive channel
MIEENILKTTYRRVSAAVVLTFCFLALLFGPQVLKAAQETRSGQLPAELEKMETDFLELKARLKTLDEYAPDKYPDFKDLELANQLVEQLDFSRRKSELLVEQYNILEDKLFPFALEHARKHPESTNLLTDVLNKYTGKAEMSVYDLQERINHVFLRIDRLEERLEHLQVAARNKEIEEEKNQKAKEIRMDASLSAKLRQLEEDLKITNAKIDIEKTKLEELKAEEKKRADKIEEKKKEIIQYQEREKKAANRVERLILQTFVRVREIRLNGLEIPRLNAIKTFVYLSETNTKTLEEKRQNNEVDIAALEKQQREELIGKLLKGVLIIGIAMFVVFLVLRISHKVSRKVIQRLEESETLDSHRKQRYQTLSSVILTFIKVALWAMAVLWVLGELEIDYAPFLVAAGGISLAIGFGAQSLVKDVVSGFFILMEEQFALGDGVEIGGVSGTIEKISLRTVKIRSLDGTLHTIPSGSISRVSNKTYQWSRAVVKVGASYDNDPQKVLEVLDKVAKDMAAEEEWKGSFIEEPSAQGILSFGDSAIEYRVLAKTPAGSQWTLGRELHIRIKNAFDREGIEIPYNYLNVNVLDFPKKIGE